MITGGLGVFLIARYGTTVTHAVAAAVGLPQCPNTVAGVLYGPCCSP
ncbi:hypothetical protein [Amycolatopsis acidiphila]|nr:hypothetical protein [Amycolatopsis acidiphila]GHG84661.1 hypothetical protein GCM10017788_56950 [Amycolatopsis acidiphila]